MKRGVSTVIAVVLILIIVTTLSAASYYIYSSLSTRLTSTGEEVLEETIKETRRGAYLLSATLYLDKDLALWHDFTEYTFNCSSTDECDVVFLDNSPYNNSGVIEGNIKAQIVGINVIADFENSLDGFSLDCGGKPTYEFVDGIRGKAVFLFSTGGDALACMWKAISAVNPGDTIYFWGKGWVRAGIWCPPVGKFVSYIEDVFSGCKSSEGQTAAWSVCNGGKPYEDWRLFKLVAAENCSDPRIFFYNRGGGHVWYGREYGACYDYVVRGRGYFVPGKYGWAMEFNEYNNVYLQGNLPYNTSGSVTMLAWIYPIGSGGTIVALGGSEYPGLGMTSWKICLNNKKNAERICADTPLDANKWYFVAGVITPSKMKIYINGEKVKEGAATGTADDTYFRVGVGTGYHWGYFKGLVDEIFIYNRELTEEEIRACYEDINKCPRDDSLLIHLTFDEKFGRYVNNIGFLLKRGGSMFLRVDGTSREKEYVKVRDAPSLHSDDFSVIVKARVNTCPAGGHIIAKEYDALVLYDDSYVIWMPGGTCTIKGHTSVDSQSGAGHLGYTISAGDFDVIYAKEYTHVYLYVNGTLRDQGTVSSPYVNFDNSSLFIGADDNDNNEIGDQLWTHGGIYYAMLLRRVVEPKEADILHKGFFPFMKLYVEYKGELRGLLLIYDKNKNIICSLETSDLIIENKGNTAIIYLPIGCASKVWRYGSRICIGNSCIKINKEGRIRQAT